MIKKTTLKNILFLMFGFIAYSINAQTFYYEDFRFENEGRGFTVQKVALGGQAANQIGKRVGDVVDAADSSPVFDVNSRPANRIPQGTARAQRTIAFTNVSEPTTGNFVNHEIEGWVMMTNQDLSATNAPKVSFWTQKRSVYGTGAALTVWVSENYTHGTSPSTASWTNETANVVGNIATIAQTYVKGELDLSAYNGASVTVAFKMVTDNTTFSANVSQHGTFYISDVNFEAAKEDVTNGAFTALNTSATGQTGIFNTPSAAIAESNFSNTSKWADVLTTETSVPRLANGQLIPVGEGYKLKVADKYNPIAISEVRYIQVNGASNKGAPDNSKWIMQGSNDDTNWDDLSATIEMFSASNNTETTAALTTTKAYRYYRFSLQTAWTPNSGFTAIKQLDFTVDSSIVLSTEKNTLSNAFKVYPNPTDNFINITNLNIEVKNVQLIDVTGKVIYKNTNAQPIDVKNYSKGLYILKIASKKGGITSKKVVIN